MLSKNFFQISRLFPRKRFRAPPFPVFPDCIPQDIVCPQCGPAFIVIFLQQKNFFLGSLRGCFAWKWGLCLLTRPYTSFFISGHIKYRPRIFTPLFFYCWQNENFSCRYPCPNSEPDELRDARRLPQGAAAGVARRLPRGGRGKRGLAGGRGRVEARRDAGLTSPLVGHGWPLCCARAGRSSAQGANTRKGEQAHGCAVTWRRKTVIPAPLSLV